MTHSCTNSTIIYYWLLPLACKSNTGDIIDNYIVNLLFCLVKERIMYTDLILTFKVCINRSVSLCLCELIVQQNSSTNSQLANDDVLLILPPPCRNCANNFLAFPPLLYGVPYE